MPYIMPSPNPPFECVLTWELILGLGLNTTLLLLMGGVMQLDKPSLILSSPINFSTFVAYIDVLL